LLDVTLTSLFNGFCLQAGLIVAIGAQNAYVFRQGLRKHHVFLIVTLCALFDAMLIALGVAGMGGVLHRSPVVFDWVRYIGAAFLMIYGLRALVSAWRGDCRLESSDGADASVFTTAVTVIALSALNPHVYFDAFVLLTVVGPLSWPARGWFAVGAMAASVVWFSLLGFGANSLRSLFGRELAWRALDTTIGLVMLAFATSLLLAH
jgi:L-lysine exporter family protein LysE/ArgO